MQVAGDYRIVPIIRTQLTQNIGNFFNECFEEITNGCDEFIGNKYDGKYFFLLPFVSLFVSSATMGLTLTCSNDYYHRMGIRKRYEYGCEGCI